MRLRGDLPPGTLYSQDIINGTVVHRPTRGIGEGHYLFIYYGLSPNSGNPVRRVVRAVLAANLAPPAAYPGYLDPYPLAPPNKPTNFGLDQLVLVGSRLSCSSSLVHQVLSYGLSPVVFPIYTRIPRLIFRAKLGQLTKVLQ